MNSLCERVIADFASSIGAQGVIQQPWYLITGKAGPNAVLKIVLPPARGAAGYVLTVARHPDTQVIKHEVDILGRLRHTLPERVAKAVPQVLLHSSCAGCEYFAAPFYEAHGHGRLTRWLARRRRVRWATEWLTDLARATLGNGLTRRWLEAEYGRTIRRIQGDPRVKTEVKSRVRKHFEAVCDNVEQIPSVCCHGDIWAGNLLWRRWSNGAVVLDWGATRWPGLPAADLCRYLLASTRSAEDIKESILAYCHAIDLDPAFIPALYDLYKVFMKTESDIASAHDPDSRFDPFMGLNKQARQKLSDILGTTGPAHGPLSLLGACRGAVWSGTLLP